ncbi:MAG: DNA polymerase I [Acidobacteriota bacterium]
MAARKKPASKGKEAKPRLFLIDGYSNIFRAFYAIRELSNSKGEPTNAVYGFLNMLRKLLREEKPELVGIGMDTSGATLRKEKFEDYKANRRPMPDDLRSQLPWIRTAIEAMKIPMLEAEGYEADDVLGTMALKAAAEGYEVVLVTADKDFFQLVSDDVSVYHSFREKLYDPALVEEDFGVPPHQVVDVLALMGDSIDNVPGVPGIGEKGAKNLIKEHGTLEALLEAAPEIKRKNYREGLTHHREEALLSQELVTIETELDVAFDPDGLKLDAPDREALIELYRELDFFSLLKEMEADAAGASLDELEPAVDVESGEQWQECLEDAGAEVLVTLIGPWGAPRALGLRAADEGGTAYYVDLAREELHAPVCAGLRDLLEQDEATFVGHDLKEVVRLVARHGASWDVRARLRDTMLLAYLLRGASRSYDLADVALDRLGRSPTKESDAGLEKGSEPAAGDERLRLLVAERLETVRLLAEQLEEQLAEAPPALDQGPAAPEMLGDGEAWVYSRVEEPLVPVLLRMEEAGIELDTEFLAEMSAELGKETERLEEEIYEIAGERFNVNSPKKLGEIMYERLGYPIVKRTRKTKSYSTDAATLEELAARGFDLPVKLMDYREYSKLRSTYLEALPLLVAEDGRLHTHYQQAVAATGRLSSTNPNLQNIPIRTEVGQRIRKGFRAASGHRLLVADYSQIELRILAHIAGVEALIEAFNTDADIHRSTAGSVFGVAPELVSDEQRRVAKMINFGIIYGMSAFGLSQRLGIPRGDAKNFIEAYFEQFPAVQDYTDTTLEQVEQEGRVQTLYGRSRWLPDINSRNRNMRENAKRMAINARIQGTAADVQKLAMISVDDRLRKDFPDAKLLLTVHDELVVEAPESSADAVGEALVSEMQGVAELVVPLKVELGSGETWYDAKD